MSLKWYLVDITARDPRGFCKRIQTVVQAESAAAATTRTARDEWGIDLYDYDRRQGRGGRATIYCDGWTLDHETLEEAATEVTDPVVLARLDGAPTLTLNFGDEPTAAPYAPDAYQRQALATWGSGSDPLREQQMHALLGLAGETGETGDLLKKHFFKPGREATREMVLDELADVAYYVAVLAHLWEFTFDDMFAHLAGKLAGGYGWVNPSNSVGLEGDRE